MPYLNAIETLGDKTKQGLKKRMWRIPRGVVVNVLDYDIAISEFDLSPDYVHFRTFILRKGMKTRQTQNCYMLFEQMQEAALHKTAAVYQLTFHLTNHAKDKTNKICRVLLVK